MLKPVYLKAVAKRNRAGTYLQHKVYNMRLFDRLLSTVAPHSCLGCGSEGHLLCNSCSFEKLPELPSRCAFCLAATQDFTTCSKCRKLYKLNSIWVSTAYTDLGKELVGQLKFGGKRSAALDIARIMKDRLPFFDSKTIVVHIPTAASRIRVRGFDQSKLIAQCLSAELGLLHVSALHKLGQARQLGSTKAERTRNVEGSFWASNNPIIKGAQILLVDDVFTTGATLNEAAKVLRRAGARQVDVAVFAQKV